MAFIEEGSVEYVEIDGKKVPVVKCETEVILRILMYSGVVIRDPQIVQAAAAEATQQEMNQKQ